MLPRLYQHARNLLALIVTYRNTCIFRFRALRLNLVIPIFGFDKQIGESYDSSSFLYACTFGQRHLVSRSYPYLSLPSWPFFFFFLSFSFVFSLPRFNAPLSCNYHTSNDINKTIRREHGVHNFTEQFSFLDIWT